jgi:hypothetical protein
MVAAGLPARVSAVSDVPAAHGTLAHPDPFLRPVAVACELLARVHVEAPFTGNALRLPCTSRTFTL